MAVSANNMGDVTYLNMTRLVGGPVNDPSCATCFLGSPSVLLGDAWWFLSSPDNFSGDSDIVSMDGMCLF